MAAVVMDTVLPFVDFTSLLPHPEKLRLQAQELGYACFRGLLPPADVMDLRRRILELCSGEGWLDAGAPILAGIAAKGCRVVEGEAAWFRFYAKAQRLRAFHALNHHPALLAAIGALIGGPVLPHPRVISRVVMPGTARHTTPPHQDYWYIHGTRETWTTWLPLGDCPSELGGLALLPGSHLRGVLPMRPSLGPGGQEVDADLAGDWHTGPMHCGDVLVFNSLTVHQARDNHTADRVRLSADFRYQSPQEPIDPASLRPHGDVVSWDDIYAGWPAEDPLKSYWKQTNPSPCAR